MTANNAGSWIITCLTSGTVWETFDKADADKAHESNAVLVETALEYLGRINEETKMNIDDFELDDEALEQAQANREKRLQEDEQPVDLEGADDCGDSCTI